MLDVGRVCVKLAGRDAGKTCVIVDVLDKEYVLVDGETRRRKVNVQHLEPTAKTIDVAKGASHDDVKSAFKTHLQIDLPDKKPKAAKVEQTGKLAMVKAKVVDKK